MMTATQSDRRPQVSVVMAVYNGAPHLAATLTSIHHQIDIDLEFIIIDDGSTDATPTILREYAAQDPRLRIFRQSNQGLTRALIQGCRRARGAFIARQDVGDISLPTRLVKQATVLQEDPCTVLVYCAYDLIGPDDELLVESCLQNSTEIIADSLRRLDPATLSGPAHGTVMFRKQAYDAVGGYRPAFYFAQDLDLWVRLITVGNVVGLPDVLCRQRFSFGSLSALHVSKQRQLRQIIAAAETLRRQGGSQSDILAVAASVTPTPSRFPALEAARAAYFVGSNLARRGDHRRARAYLFRAIQANPLHLKAWFKLLASAGAAIDFSVSR